MMNQFPCPQCGRTQWADRRTAGLQFSCPGCGFRGTAPTEAGENPEDPRPAAPVNDASARSSAGQASGPPTVGPGGEALAVAYARPVAGPNKTLAVLSLVLGCVGIIPCLGFPLALTGIVLGIISLAMRRPGRRMAIGGIVAGVVGLLVSVGAQLAPFILFSSSMRTGTMGRAMCTSNLHQIGSGLTMYSVQNNSSWPPDLQTLVTTGDISANVLICPDSVAGRAQDYFYLPPANVNAGSFGPGGASKALVACDLLSNHHDGRNVLRADHLVTWMNEEDFQAELARPQNAAFAAALRALEAPPPEPAPVTPESVPARAE